MAPFQVCFTTATVTSTCLDRTRFMFVVELDARATRVDVRGSLNTLPNHILLAPPVTFSAEDFLP